MNPDDDIQDPDFQAELDALDNTPDDYEEHFRKWQISQGIKSA